MSVYQNRTLRSYEGTRVRGVLVLSGGEVSEPLQYQVQGLRCRDVCLWVFFCVCECVDLRVYLLNHTCLHAGLGFVSTGPHSPLLIPSLTHPSHPPALSTHTSTFSLSPLPFSLYLTSAFLLISSYFSASASFVDLARRSPIVSSSGSSLNSHFLSDFPILFSGFRLTFRRAPFSYSPLSRSLS